MDSNNGEIKPHEVPEATHLWDRQTGETGVAYRLFSVYRDMGINRDLRTAAKDMGRVYKTVKNLSIVNQWENRCLCHDEHNNRETERKLQYEIIEARKRHHRLGSIMMDFAQESIENLRAMNDILTVRDIVALTECGHKIESTALGMSSEITESRIAADVKLQQHETIPIEILERIGKEIAAAKSAGEDVEDITAQFEEMSQPQLLAPENGNGNGSKIPVKA